MVLDTNVVLDWLVFADPRGAALANALQTGRVRWLVSRRMRDELDAVLRGGRLERWQPDHAAALAAFDRCAVTCPDPPPAPLALRCADPDDQVFVDLAIGERCDWLLTHDRALLALSRRARRHGLTIVRPAAWAGADPSPAGDATSP